MKIWRGDQDSSSIRQIRTSVIGCDGLYSNMINSGNPLALGQQGFIQSIHNHVVPGWNTTHFLSFSKNKSVAEKFAVGNSRKTLFLSDRFNWQTLISEIDLGKLKHVNSLAVGIDHYQFNEVNINHGLFSQNALEIYILQCAINNRRAANIPLVKNILTIDVHQHLNHLVSTGVTVDPLALKYSLQDEEILILPIDPFWGGMGNTALIDMGCISSVEFFELI